MSQSQNDVSVKLNGISFNLDKFRIDLKNPDPDIHNCFLSFGRMNFGFSDIEMSLDEFDNSRRSTFAFKGPNFTLDNLDFNIAFDSPNPWQTLIKEFNLLQNNPNAIAQNISRNEMNFHLGGIELLFASQGSFDMNNNNKLVEFQLDKAFFRVSNAKVDLMHNNMLSSKLTVKIMDYHINLDNIFFELNNSNDVPRVEKFSGEIALKNLEIQIPDEIYMQSGFKQLSTLFGMRTNIFRLRQIAMEVRFVDSNNCQLDATVYSPFATITMNGNFSIRQHRHHEPEVYINNLSFSVPYLSRGLNDLVTQWENKNNQHIPRKAGAIFIELSGEPDNLQVKGLDIKRLKF